MAEYCTPVWSASAHMKAIDIQLNAAMRTVSGTFKMTKTEWLPILCNIALPAICRDVPSSRYFSQILATKIPAQHLLTEHPHCHFKSQNPPWKHAELFTGAHQSEAKLWRASWEAATTPNKHLVHDPIIASPVSHSHIGNGQPSAGSARDRPIAIAPSTDGG